MITLKGQHIYLRALEPEDLEFVYAIENNEEIWEISNTQTPYSRFLIRQYLENAHQDIYEAKQLRLAICLLKSDVAVGLIDLFDFDPKNNRAGIGILIQKEEDRTKGIGTEALQLVIQYAFHQLQLHQLYANIGNENSRSLQLFSKFGFQKIGIKKDWNLNNGKYQDEYLFQLINFKK
ncbi:GNAT family N-acetyltransferase [Flavobacterium sp. NRK F7]|uniref:GNAT family N-acetyltransferase n=1 Tax=Flavobacterium sp. NRK F7 TaxID=2954930 RepID=UPI002091A1EE|nr:GNAT family N-acetyltransferase [Flavobacterium sp. NRK F7]MCO6162724.1 GNAT family N-acetyltransferase [Flavobacterium sp. NRK F7]